MISPCFKQDLSAAGDFVLLRAHAKDLLRKDFAGRGATCRKARKSMLAYFYRQKAASRRAPAVYNLRPQSLPTVCNSTINPAFPRRGRGTALAVDEASFDSHPRSKTCRYARSNAGTRFIKVYKIYIIIVQINR